MSYSMPARLPRYMSPTSATALVALALVLVLWVLVRTLIQRQKGGAQRHIVLAGPCGGGKTHLFTRVRPTAAYSHR